MGAAHRLDRDGVPLAGESWLSMRTLGARAQCRTAFEHLTTDEQPLQVQR
jgi:hypothetical protein